jgi:hypothetical protein
MTLSSLKAQRSGAGATGRICPEGVAPRWNPDRNHGNFQPRSDLDLSQRPALGGAGR